MPTGGDCVEGARCNWDGNSASGDGKKHCDASGNLLSCDCNPDVVSCSGGGGGGGGGGGNDYCSYAGASPNTVCDAGDYSATTSGKYVCISGKEYACRPPYGSWCPNYNNGSPSSDAYCWQATGGNCDVSCP
jgi:hypothetical protein